MLSLTESIIDGGSEGNNGSPSELPFAISGSSNDPANSWGAPTEINGVTVYGQIRVESINGRGGLCKNRMEVLDDQHGCLKFCYFSGDGDRLPQNYGCVNGRQARLDFESDIFGHPAYGQTCKYC